MAVAVPAADAEPARAAMLELFPEGFEEVERRGALELAGYTDASGEQRVAAVFGSATAAPVGEGWEHRWREFHRSALVGGVWVGPPWEQPPTDAVIVVIEPGRAFGTGAHPTTRICLQLLQELRRGSLLDVGSGSGVLAVAAAKLGFGPITALDDDPAALEATEQNAARNGVSVATLRGDAVTVALPPADVAVANISLGAVEAVGARIAARTIVTSGYLAREQPSLAHVRTSTAASSTAGPPTSGDPSRSRRGARTRIRA